MTEHNYATSGLVAEDAERGTLEHMVATCTCGFATHSTLGAGHLNRTDRFVREELDEHIRYMNRKAGLDQVRLTEMNQMTHQVVGSHVTMTHTGKDWAGGSTSWSRSYVTSLTPDEVKLTSVNRKDVTATIRPVYLIEGDQP